MENQRLLFIDIETYSSVDIASCGAYKYQESIDFEVLIVGYAFGNDEPVIVDLAQGEKLPNDFVRALLDENVKKVAHNSVFERTAFRHMGYETSPEDWLDTMIMAAYCGLPLALDSVCKVLGVKDAKLSTGKALIRYFSCPVKPTKINGYRHCNLPSHNIEKWEMYKTYNKYDVLSEREIYYRLEPYAKFSDFERRLWSFDQGVNDRGVLIDAELAESAIALSEEVAQKLYSESTRLTGLDNPNSPVQLKKWYYDKYFGRIKANLSERDKDRLTGENEVLFNSGSLVKEAVSLILSLDAVKAYPELSKVLMNRQSLGRASTKKYAAMLNCMGADGRARGAFQFYGANRTGRWAGRLIQLQNMSKNHFKDGDTDTPRDLVRHRDLGSIELVYGNCMDVLSQLVRTALIPPPGKKFCVADFSAIEARVISWIAGEEWRLEVFRTTGKIYEATASRMFGVPVEAVTKDSDYRKKGKVSELALGYAGGVGAMKAMGAEAMGLTERDMMESVSAWRAANPKICALWRQYGKAAEESIRYHRRVAANKVVFATDDTYMTIELPSSRRLFYYRPRVKEGPKGVRIIYEGMNQETKVWGEIDTHGGKIVENVVQAVSRDLIGYAMMNSEAAGFPVVMHIHDEEIAEVPDDGKDKEHLDTMIKIMSQAPDWAKGLPLNAAGFTSYYYMKD